MINKLKKTLRHNHFVWKYYLNLEPTFRYLFNPVKIEDKKIEKILEELRKNGVALASAAEVIGTELLKELEQEAQRLRTQNASFLSDKDYAKFYLEQVYDPSSIWARVAESKNVKDIASSYFQMNEPRLVYYDLWENLPSNDSPKNAQLWHRDRDDLQILKVFIYFTDVDEETGSFLYAPGTHILGTFQKEPTVFIDESKTSRSYDENMDQVVPKEKWISGKGLKGTIVFADTHGYHKGGFVKDKFRFLYTCMYLSRYSGRIRFSNVSYK
jgi:hypothetical protein